MIMHTTDRHRAHAVANCLAFLLTAVLIASTAFATESRLVPFQARLTDASGADLTGVYRVTFVIYDAATGGTALWSEVHPSVSVMAGRLNVLLGSLTSLDDYNGDGNPSDAIQFDQPRFVGIKVGTDTNQEMVPRHQLVPAFQARNADKLGGYGPEYLVPKGAILMWSGLISNIPNGWALCDGTNGTPDLRDRFIVSAGGAYSVGSTGGTRNQTVPTVTQAGGAHSHAHDLAISPGGSHSHPYEGKTGPEVDAAGWFDSGDNDRRWLTAHKHDFTGTTSSAADHMHPIIGAINNGGTHQHNLSVSFDVAPPYYALAYILKL